MFGSLNKWSKNVARFFSVTVEKGTWYLRRYLFCRKFKPFLHIVKKLKQFKVKCLFIFLVTFLSFDFVLLIRHIDVDFQGNFSFWFLTIISAFRTQELITFSANQIAVFFHAWFILFMRVKSRFHGNYNSGGDVNCEMTKQTQNKRGSTLLVSL